MKVIRSTNLKYPLVRTQILKSGTLVVVDAKTTIRIMNKKKLELIDGYKADINHLRYKSRVVDFASDGKAFASLSSDCKESRLYSSRTKKLITKVDRHHGEASCVGIEPMSKYMFSCGDDGKTFAIDIASGKLAFTLPVHVDTVNDIAFSSNGNWVATASYDRKISLFNLTMMAPKHKLQAHSAPVMKIAFIGQNRLCSVDKNNKGIIWNIYSGKVVERLEGIHDDVTEIVVADYNQFIFLGTALGYVLLYDANTYQLLSKKYIKVPSAITSMAFDEDAKELIIGCDNGDLLVYNIYEGVEYITTLLKEKKYTEIQNHIDTNPTLEYTEIYSLVANLWENTVNKAIACLQKGDKQTAIKLFSYFKNIPSKNKIMQEIMREYNDYDKFKDFAMQGKYILAYNIANQHPMYKDSPIYKSLEKRWQKTFALAQKHAMDPKGLDKAKEILAPFRGISEKTKLMQDLFTEAEVYKRFKAAIGQKDFAIVFELIKIHPFLMEFPEYSTLMDYADSLYIKSQEFINAGDTHSAIKVLRILRDFPDFKSEVKELMIDIEAKQEFFKAVRDEDMVCAYNMLDLSDDLLLTEDGKKLQEQWHKDLEKANQYAVDGNVLGVKSVLENYMKINSKYMAIGTIFGWCYMVQLERAIEQSKEQSAIEEGIKNYILNFGLQDQILSLYEIFKSKYKNSKLNLELLTKGSLEMWRPSMVVDSILEE